MLGEVPCDSLSLAEADDPSLEHRRDYCLEREVDSILLGLTLIKSLTCSIDGNNYQLAQGFVSTLL